MDDKKKLNDEELKKVSGGGSSEEVTEMKCTGCGYGISWSGNFAGQTFDCPRCGKHTFEGTHTKHSPGVIIVV